MAAFSNVFKNMDEVKAYAESMKNRLSADDYELLLYLFGLLENRGVSEAVQLHGNEVKIDRFLAPMIIDLNRNGVETLACCSALQKEHAGCKYKPDKGYLSIAYDEVFINFLQEEIKNPLIAVTKSECYLRPAISLEVEGKDDSAKEANWNYVWAILKSWYENHPANNLDSSK